MLHLSTYGTPLCTHYALYLGQLVTFAYFLCPIMSLNITKKITRVDHDIEGCKNLGRFRSKLLICSKGDFSGKLTTITIFYLVSPIILQHFKQIFRDYH